MRRILRKISTIGITFLLILNFGSLVKSQSQNQREAKHLWEQAIDAKGGRERLHAVENMVQSSGKKYQNVFFFAFPDKIWSWMDDRQTPIGLAVDMANAELGIAYLIYPEKPPIDMGAGGVENGKQFLKEAQLMFLMETKWLKPIPYKTEKGEIDGRPVDIVYTKIDDKKISFSLDQKTHLPRAITSYSWFAGITYPSGKSIPAGEISLTEKFKDYALVSGIQVPHSVCFACYSGRNQRGREQYTRLNFQINVDYNKDIFKKAPTIEGGAEAWKLQ